MSSKCCWVARKYRKGWKLGFAIGNKPTVWLRGVYFMDETSVQDALMKSGVVYVHMRKDDAK